MKSFVCRYCSCCYFEAHCPHLTFDNGKKRKHAAAVETVLISFSSYFCSVDQQKKVKRKRKESTRFVLFGYNFLCSRRQRPTLKNSKNGSRQTVKKGTTINCRAVWQVYSVFTLFSAFFCFEYSPLRSWQSSILTVVVGVVGVLVSTSRLLSFPSTFFPLPPFLLCPPNSCSNPLPQTRDQSSLSSLPSKCLHQSWLMSTTVLTTVFTPIPSFTDLSAFNLHRNQIKQRGKVL